MCEQRKRASDVDGHVQHIAESSPRNLDAMREAAVEARVSFVSASDDGFA